MGKRVIGRRASAVTILALAVATPAAPAAVIGFDDLPSGTLVDEEYAARGVHFGPSPFPDMSGAVTTIAKGQARSAPNVAALAYDTFNTFSSSWIRFDEPQTQVRFHACRTGGPGDPPQPNVNADAYDSNGNLVANVQDVQCNLNGDLVPVTVTAPNISYINVGATGSDWAIDDLVYARRPLVATSPASAVTADGAKLNGTVNPNGQATTYRFEYGTTTSYGSQTSQQAAGSTNSSLSVSATLTGLLPGATYHYRLGATNIDGSANGPDQSFRTAGTPTEQPPGCPQRGILLIGTAGNDSIVGSALSAVIQGRGGNDRLTGLGANDCLYGETGNDRLSGGGGRDRLVGGSGNDRSNGSSGNDRISGGTGNDRLSGGSGDDTVTGSSGTDQITGGSGGDRISAGTGGDRILVRDRTRDAVDCGSGRDRVTADRRDRVARDCERVARR